MSASSVHFILSFLIGCLPIQLYLMIGQSSIFKLPHKINKLTFLTGPGYGGWGGIPTFMTLCFDLLLSYEKIFENKQKTHQTEAFVSQSEVLVTFSMTFDRMIT